MFSSSTYGDRAPDRSYKRPNLAHSQSALNYSTLGPSQQALSASQLPPSWSTSFNAQTSLGTSTRDGGSYLPGYLLSASQGMVSEKLLLQERSWLTCSLWVTVAVTRGLAKIRGPTTTSFQILCIWSCCPWRFWSRGK
jgi:hypothetical protein